MVLEVWHQLDVSVRSSAPCNTQTLITRSLVNNPHTENRKPQQPAKATPASTWRITLGTWMFYVPFIIVPGAPIVIPLLGISATQAAAIVGGVVLVSEIIWFASIPLLGKEGFKRLKSQAFGVLKPGSGPIGRGRHRMGVWMFTGGISFQILLGVGVVIAYFAVGADDISAKILGLDFEQQALAFAIIQIAAVVSVLASLYVLGADFLERLGHAFDWAGP